MRLAEAQLVGVERDNSHDVFLTIDLDLQQVAENTFKTLGQAKLREVLQVLLESICGHLQGQ